MFSRSNLFKQGNGLTMKYFLTLFLIVVISGKLYSVTLEELIPQPKISFKYAGSRFLGNNSLTKLVISADTLGKPERAKTARYMQSILNQRLKNGVLKEIIPLGVTNNGVIIIADESEIGKIKPIGDALYENIGTRTTEQINNSWYVLEITDTVFALIGKDDEGLRAGINTIFQLMGDKEAISKVKIIDWADYKYRWVFSQHNLRGLGDLERLTKIADTMALRNLNGIQQGDFKYAIIPEQPSNYFDSVAKFSKVCNDRNLEIIPSVCGVGWSSGILWNDPNLAEGLKTVVNYVVEADSARLIPDPKVVIPNGGFEIWGGNNKFSNWSYYDEQFATQDFSEYHSGSSSAKCTGFNGANSRFTLALKVSKNRAYLLTAWVKTKNFSGDEIKLMVLSQKPDNSYVAITFAQMSVPATSNGWIKLELIFNTLNYENIILYAGVWGANSGTIWWDDFSIKDYGLTNILRRAGTPLIVKDAFKKNNIVYEEGVDFAKLVDPILQNRRGEYGPYHQAPKFNLFPNSKIKNGDTISISSYHPFAAVSDNDGNGSVMVCVNEPKTDSIIKRQIFDMKRLYNPNSYFMGHDEIRNMNWDDACLHDSTDPKDMPAIQLSNNINKCVQSIQEANPKANIFMWSDMVDSLHNAYKDYYLINGDLKGVWNKIPSDKITIVNWNGGKNAKNSLNFFANKNFKQITSPYYDSKNTNSIRDWRIAQEGVNGVEGMMYTSWLNDFDFLTPFSYYAWGAGSNFIHKQPTNQEIESTKELLLAVQTLTDPYDATAKTDSVWVGVKIDYDKNQKVDYYNLKKDSTNKYSLNIPLNQNISTLDYTIYAKNSQEISTKTIEYSYLFSKNTLESEDENLIDLKLNNKTMEITSSIELQNISIADLNGKYLLEKDLESNYFKFEFQTAGTYLVKIWQNNNFTTKKVIVR